MRSFGQTVKEARNALGLTQAQLAARLRRGKSWVVDVERGRSVPTTFDAVYPIAAMLQLDPVALWSLALRENNSDLADAAEPRLWLDLGESLIDTPGDSEVTRVAPRSAAQVEEAAEKLVKKVFPGALGVGNAVPIADLGLHLAGIGEQVGRSIELSVHWGANDAEGKVYANEDGHVTMSIRDDVWHAAAEGDGRARFTIAHELGHVVLHHTHLRSGEVMFRDAVCTASARLPQGVKIYESPEYQANTFASAFLMPLDGVKVFLRQQYAAGEDCGYEALAERFKTSYQAARIRLQKLLPRLVGGPST